MNSISIQDRAKTSQAVQRVSNKNFKAAAKDSKIRPETSKQISNGILREKIPLTSLVSQSLVTYARMSQNINKHQFKIEDQRRIMKDGVTEPEL